MQQLTPTECASLQSCTSCRGVSACWLQAHTAATAPCSTAELAEQSTCSYDAHRLTDEGLVGSTLAYQGFCYIAELCCSRDAPTLPSNTTTRASAAPAALLPHLLHSPNQPCWTPVTAANRTHVCFNLVDEKPHGVLSSMLRQIPEHVCWPLTLCRPLCTARRCICTASAPL